MKRYSCVVFSLKAGRKDLKNIHFPPPTPPPPPTHCSSLLKKCWIWIHEIWTPCAGRQKTAKILLNHLGAYSGGRLSCLFVESFLPAFREKNNTGTSHTTQVGLQSLGGFWHAWKFHSKWHLCNCCPEPFNYLAVICDDVDGGGCDDDGVGAGDYHYYFY